MCARNNWLISGCLLCVFPSVLHWDASDAESLVTTVRELYLLHQIKVRSNQTGTWLQCHWHWAIILEENPTFEHYTWFFSKFWALCMILFQAGVFPWARKVCRHFCCVFNLMCQGCTLGWRVSWQSLAGQNLALSCYFCFSPPLQSLLFAWEAVGKISRMQQGRVVLLPQVCGRSLPSPGLSCRWAGSFQDSSSQRKRSPSSFNTFVNFYHICSSSLFSDSPLTIFQLTKT